MHKDKYGIPNPFDNERKRGHRIVAPVQEKPKNEKRHFTIAALIVMAAGAAVAAYGAYRQAEQQKKSLEVQSQNEANAAEHARQMGEAAKRAEARKARPFLNSFRSGAGGMGVVAAEGSPLLAELDFANQSALNAENAKYGYTLKSRDHSYNSYLTKRQAGEISPVGAAGMSLLSSASSSAGSYMSGGMSSATVKGSGPSSTSIATNYGMVGAAS